jgi:hypothetical protein
VYLSCNAKVITGFGVVNVQAFCQRDWFPRKAAAHAAAPNPTARQQRTYVSEAIQPSSYFNQTKIMSAPQIPNLLSSRGGPRSRGSRGRGRGRGFGHQDAQQRKDIDIQSTDTDAAVSRLSAVSLGYLDDPFASYFVSGAGTRRLPIINRGTTFLDQAASSLH